MIFDITLLHYNKCNDTTFTSKVKLPTEMYMKIISLLKESKEYLCARLAEEMTHAKREMEYRITELLDSSNYKDTSTTR